MLSAHYQHVGAVAEREKNCFSHRAMLTQGQMVHGLTVANLMLEINVLPHVGKEAPQREVSWQESKLILGWVLL